MTILYPLFAMVLITVAFNLFILMTRVKAVNCGVVTREYLKAFRHVRAR